MKHRMSQIIVIETWRGSSICDVTSSFNHFRAGMILFLPKACSCNHCFAALHHTWTDDEKRYGPKLYVTLLFGRLNTNIASLYGCWLKVATEGRI